MLSVQDFSKKQIVFVFFNEGEKMAFSNDNLVVRNADGKIKFQCTCYRLFIVYAVGHCSITSALVQKAKKFGFFIAMMTPGFRLYALIGAEKDGNTLLKRKQYSYEGVDIAKLITRNKIENQAKVLKSVRNKNSSVKDAIICLGDFRRKIDTVNNIQELMGYEGSASKIYFRNHFNNIVWNGRQPRLKRDIVNSLLDVGYTLLFTLIDSILCSYGFDTYCGVLHRQFYMRKSLVCDIVEPFRPIIDVEIKKAFNLKQIKDEDFIITNGQYRLKWESSAKYVKLLMTPLLERKDDIFVYVQLYYRAFMKSENIENFPTFEL